MAKIPRKPVLPQLSDSQREFLKRLERSDTARKIRRAVAEVPRAPPELKAIGEAVQRAVAAVVEEEAAPPEHSITVGDGPAVVEEYTTKQLSTKPSTVAEPEGANAPPSSEGGAEHRGSRILTPEQHQTLIEHLERAKQNESKHPRWNSQTAVVNYAIKFLAGKLKVKVLTETGDQEPISEEQSRSILRLLQRQNLLERLLRRGG